LRVDRNTQSYTLIRKNGNIIISKKRSDWIKDDQKIMKPHDYSFNRFGVKRFIDWHPAGNAVKILGTDNKQHLVPAIKLQARMLKKFPKQKNRSYEENIPMLDSGYNFK
jgi:hypothetical protein